MRRGGGSGSGRSAATRCLQGALAATLLAAATALSCWQCGKYSDGVGSITPCLNTSTLRLVACAPDADRYCIKYVSELSTVRDCAISCSEKESWGARSYCCNSDGCNPAPRPSPPLPPLAFVAGLLVLLAVAPRF